jgi:hypothetical protein
MQSLQLASDQLKLYCWLKNDKKGGNKRVVDETKQQDYSMHSDSYLIHVGAAI